ncbi:hypothetical protein, partial [Vogesella oryzae]|uniref:hypothetical protein n=1 Tax=Vogesella oryzae TaxID=1735285 RepID=UPI00158406A8
MATVSACRRKQFCRVVRGRNDYNHNYPTRLEFPVPSMHKQSKRNAPDTSALETVLNSLPGGYLLLDRQLQIRLVSPRFG